jgi:ribosomal protein S27E
VRIPLSKVYRAFPELDRFSDAECERYVLQVRIQHRSQLAALPILASALVAVLWCGGLPLLVLGQRSVRAYLRRTQDLNDLGVAATVMTLCLSVALAGYLTRDWVVRRHIAGRIDNARCANCRHSLLGLPLLASHADDAVRCPECGSVMVLHTIGLTVDDLIPRLRPSG